MAEELISVPEIAALHSRHKSAIHKVIGRLGIATHLIKREESRGQKVAYISRSDYELLLEALNDSVDAEADGVLQNTIPGSFYIVQLEPMLDVGRIKVGFATDLDERMRSHRTAAPFVKLVGKWPCKLLWEKTAIDCITAGCEKLHTEVFRAPDLDAVVETADAFFQLMPKDW
jgi:hypothetical protein